MAGIGFELRKLLARPSLFSLLRAYAYAGIISSGPWVISIVGMLLIGLLSLGHTGARQYVAQFQVSITYLIAFSLILTGLIQLAFTRFTADRLFEQDEAAILPNFLGLLLLSSLLAGTLGGATAAQFFGTTDASYRLLMVAGFVILCGIWVATIFLSGMKHYRAILMVFATGYGLSVLAALCWRGQGLTGLLAGFDLGQLLLLLGLIALVGYHFPSRRLLAFRFLRAGQLYPSLMAVGIFYNLGIWIDKLMFWFNPDTGLAVIGPLRASPIYDTPVFLAYLAIIPGMAVFLVRLETDFVEYYQRFYQGVREGASLGYLEQMRDQMVIAARQGIHQIINIQAMTTLIVLVAGSSILDRLGISRLYLPLLHVNLVAASLQVVFLGQLNIFFYLDKRRVVLVLTALLVILNGLFTAVTLELGPKFYGYGFAMALVLVVLAGFYLLDRRLQTLEYDTFMLQ